MNLENEVVKWPTKFKAIPHPFYVVRCDDHFMVCKLDDDFNLVKEMSNICWDKFAVRRWALEIAEKESNDQRQK